MFLASAVCKRRLTYVRHCRLFSTGVKDTHTLQSRSETPFTDIQRIDASESTASASLGVSSLWKRQIESEGHPLGKPRVETTAPEQLEEVFRSSVIARTASNVQLRRYLQQLEPKDHALALGAVRGARSGGLRIDSKTNEVLLDKLMDGGQLKASMETYQEMIRNRTTPTSNTYATLMRMCLQRDLPESCQKLFDEMIKRGQAPNTENYELYITSLSMENPPKWEKAVEIFDHLSRERHSKHITITTYTALLRVYLNMTPFDWRIVYNCYHELRNRNPPIPLKWETYELVAEGLRRGRAGYIRRFLTFLDAWFCVTHFRSWEFVVGLALYLAIMFLIKGVMGWVFMWFYERTTGAGRGASEAMIP